MNKIRTLLFAFLATSAFVTLSLAAQRVLADVTGTWTFSVVTENGTGTPTVVLKQEGEKLSGTYESSRMGVRTLAGTVKKDTINFVLAGDVALRFVGVIVDNDNLKGDLDMGGQGSATFTATRNRPSLVLR